MNTPESQKPEEKKFQKPAFPMQKGYDPNKDRGPDSETGFRDLTKKELTEGQRTAEEIDRGSEFPTFTNLTIVQFKKPKMEPIPGEDGISAQGSHESQKDFSEIESHVVRSGLLLDQQPVEPIAIPVKIKGSLIPTGEFDNFGAGDLTGFPIEEPVEKTDFPKAPQSTTIRIIKTVRGEVREIIPKKNKEDTGDEDITDLEFTPPGALCDYGTSSDQEDAEI